jgi:4-hydroxy-tetrahydrodipicolinate synthase
VDNEEKMAGLSGVLPVLPTVFDSQGAIDVQGMHRVIEYIIGAGAHGVVYPGLASEYDCLSRDERRQMTRMVGERIGGRVPFVVGASAVSPQDAMAYAAAGAAAGASAAMVLTPAAFADDMEAMADFFRAAHEGSGIDIMLQNAPAPMGVGLPLQKVASLAVAVNGIAYVKEETPPSGQRIMQLSELTRGSLRAVFGGGGARHVIDELMRGATGTMPACEITGVHVAMLDLFRRGDETGARDLFERTLPLLNMQAVFRWRLTKAVLQRRGLIDSCFTRAPGPELDRFDRAEVDKLLARMADLASFDSLPV